MSQSKLNKLAITLDELSVNNTLQDRKFIDSEKKYYQIVTALRNKRNSLGLTQEKLSELSNVPRTTITKVESGSRNATLQTLMSIAESMGKTIELKLA